MHVLMIEDNEDDYLLVSRTITRLGSTADCCNTLEDGLTYLEKNPSVDLVLLDMSLPDGQGLEVFDRVRERFPALPVIILSGNNADELALEAVRHGAQDYLVKGTINGDMLGRSLRYGVERKQAVEALRRSQERYRLLASNLPDIAILLYDTDLRYTLVEGNILERAGYDRKVMEGRLMRDVVPAESVERLEEAYRAALRGEVVNFERATPNLIVGVQIVPIRDETDGIIGGMVVVRDITRERQSAEALDSERNLLRTLIDAIPDLIFLKDTQSRFMIVNRSLLNGGGLTRVEEIVGKTDFDFFPREIAQAFYEDEQRVIATGQPLLNREEESIDLKTGAKVWYFTTKVPLRDENGQITGLLGISRDMTHSHDLQSENFNLALERERLLLLSQFVRDTSHDLRTPLSVILTSTYMLRRLPPEKQLERIDQIEAGVGDINKMLETIHYTAQLWSLSRLNREHVKLNNMVETVCSRLTPLLDAKHQQFDLRTAALTVEAEPTYLSQALFEILDNACSFTQQNGSISVRQFAENGKAVIEIKDNGIGMTDEEAGKAFDMFWRADASRNEHKEHHGLGLAIARRIIDLHGGSIAVSSQPQVGTTFTLTLPIHAVGSD